MVSGQLAQASSSFVDPRALKSVKTKTKQGNKRSPQTNWKPVTSSSTISEALNPTPASCPKGRRKHTLGLFSFFLFEEMTFHFSIWRVKLKLKSIDFA